MKNRVVEFINKENVSPVLAGFASGLYPMLYYYNANFTFVNSWEHLFFFCSTFLLLPILSFSVLYFLVKKTTILNKYKAYILPVFNFCVFVFLIIISTSGFYKKRLLVALIIAFVLALILKKHLKKVIVLQLLMAGMVFFKLVPDLYERFSYSTDWMKQKDNIEAVIFKKRPNVYLIQPDGYVNFSELKKEPYSYDNSDFESFLKINNFKLYTSRSNYYSTLSSNSSMFTMKHHRFNKLKFGAKELGNSRRIIAGNNAVISIFKKNNYKTNLLLEYPYLVVNRPNIAYDYCNINLKELSYLSRGFEFKTDLRKDLSVAINNNKDTNNFYFIEKMDPGHISTMKSFSKGIEQEKQNYLKDLEVANDWLKDVINQITTEDGNALIIIAADHGGFVGLDCTQRVHAKISDKDLVYSIFSSALAIKWPNEIPEFDDKLKTNINLFRILFSYLSEDERYINNLEEDKSYLIINKDSPVGVYEMIDENGEVVFDRVED